MNAKRKEAAIKAYEAIPVEELEASLQADDKAYTPEEIAEIIEGIKAKGGSQGAKPEQPKADKAKKKKPFVEWQMEITQSKEGPKAEKMKQIREVNITKAEADTLNAGALYGGSKYVKMYFANE